MSHPDAMTQVPPIVAREMEALFGSHLDAVLLYGSRARGDFNEDSDFDICVLVNIAPEVLMNEYRRRVTDIASAIGLEYDVLVSVKLRDTGTFNRDKSFLPFYRSIEKDGKLIAAR